MMQYRTRQETGRANSAGAKEPPQPIELRSIEAEFYDALEDATSEDAAISRQAANATEDGRPIATGTSGCSPQTRQEARNDELSPARRLAAPMFIATCLVLGLLTHGADANRLLSFWPQAEAPLPQAEAAPSFSGAWRQIGRHRDATTGRDAVAVPADAEKPVEEPPPHESTAGATEPPPPPVEPLATQPIDLEQGEAFFVPIAVDLICTIPVVFDLARPDPDAVASPALPQAALTDLYPFEPWSMRPSDAGPVGRAQVVVQAAATGARVAGLPRPEAQAPAAPLAKTVVKPKPDIKPTAPSRRPVSSPASAPSTPAWSQDAFRF